MVKNKWSIEEDCFVTQKYKEGYSLDEIVLGLDRSLASVKMRIKILGLIEPREKDGLWRCARCKEYKEVSLFRIDKRHNKPQSYCRKCTNEHSKEMYVKRKLEKELSQKPKDVTKEEVYGNSERKCSKCGELKSINDFPWNKKFKVVDSYCSECHAKRTKEYTLKRLKEKGY